MGGPSIVFAIFGVLSLLGSAVSLGMTFLAYAMGDPWSPPHTVSFFSRVFGHGLSGFSFLDSIGLRSVMVLLDETYLYQLLLALGFLFFFFAMAARARET